MQGRPKECIHKPGFEWECQQTSGLLLASFAGFGNAETHLDFWMSNVVAPSAFCAVNVVFLSCNHGDEMAIPEIVGDRHCELGHIGQCYLAKNAPGGEFSRAGPSAKQKEAAGIPDAELPDVGSCQLQCVFEPLKFDKQEYARGKHQSE